MKLGGAEVQITYKKYRKEITAEYASRNLDTLKGYFEDDLSTEIRLKDASNLFYNDILSNFFGDTSEKVSFTAFTTTNEPFLLSSVANYKDHPTLLVEPPEKFILYNKEDQPHFRLIAYKRDALSHNLPSLNIIPKPNILQKLIFNPNGDIENTVSSFQSEKLIRASSNNLNYILNLNNGKFSQSIFNNNSYDRKQIAYIDYINDNSSITPTTIHIQNQQIDLDKISIDSLLNLLVRKYPSNNLSTLSKAINNRDFNHIATIKSIDMTNNTIQKTYFDNQDENLNPKNYVIDLNAQGVRIEGTDKNHYNFYDSANNLAYIFKNEKGVKTYTKYYQGTNIISDIITIDETNKQKPQYSLDLYDRRGAFVGTQPINLFIKKLFVQTFLNKNIDTQSIDQFYNTLKLEYDNLANNAYQEIDL